MVLQVKSLCIATLLSHVWLMVLKSIQATTQPMTALRPVMRPSLIFGRTIRWRILPR